MSTSVIGFCRTGSAELKLPVDTHAYKGMRRSKGDNIVGRIDVQEGIWGE